MGPLGLVHLLNGSAACFRTPSATGVGAAPAPAFASTTASLALGGAYVERWGQDFGEEFGKVHVIEILGGDPAGDPGKVIHDNRLQAAATPTSSIRR